MHFPQGGKEHGVPIIISEIHEGMPAERCQDLFVGDAILSVNQIDLQAATHAEAVHVLSRVHGDITMELLNVSVDDSSGDEEGWEQDYNQRYRKCLIYVFPFEKCMFKFNSKDTRGASNGVFAVFVLSTLNRYLLSLTVWNFDCTIFRNL